MTSARVRFSAGLRRWEASFVGHGWRRVNEMNLATHVLALSAQQVLCTAPLVVALSQLLQRINGTGVGAELSRFLGLRAKAAQDMDALFSGSQRLSTPGLLLGLVLAVGFATGLAATQQRGFELMWHLPREQGIRTQIRQVLWAIALSAYVGAIISTGRVAHALHPLIPVGALSVIVFQVVLTFGFYWWSQRLLLGGRVAWPALLPGAIAIAVGTTLLVRLSRLFLPGQITSQVADYGLIGAVFVLSFGLVILSSLIFGGALLGAVITERRAAVSLRKQR